MTVTPLALAAQPGHLDVMDLMLNAGADINGGAMEKVPFQQEMDPTAGRNLTPIMLATLDGQKQAAMCVARMWLGRGGPCLVYRWSGHLA